MTPEDAFLAAILAAPDEDGPRLMYADWLVEHGWPERGEFIKVQCQIDALNRELLGGEDCEDGDCLGCSERRPLQGREQELLHHNDCTYWPTVRICDRLGLSCMVYRGIDGPTTQWMDGEDNSTLFTFRRGFAEVVELKAADFLKHAEGLFAVTPVREVRLTGLAPMEREDGWAWVDTAYFPPEQTIHAGGDCGVPTPIFGWLLMHDPDEEPGDVAAHYPTAQDAHNALSLACVRLGRERARRMR
jgi:uncharacterized protein (TIGR02996 family)